MLILTILVFAITIGILVMIHEFGHFIMARRAGVEVQEFAFGFKPRLWARKKKETTYAINAIPLGGYVSLLGEEQHIDHPKSFSNASVWKRIKIVFFGVLLNFILAWILLTIWFWILPDKLPDYIAIVEVKKDSPAQQADIRPNDFLIEVNGNKFTKAEELSNYNKEHQGQKVSIKIKRLNKELFKEVTLGTDENQPLGITMAETGGETPQIKWYLAPIEAIKEIAIIIWINLLFVYKIISSIFTSVQAPTDAVAGPVGIFSFLYQIISLGWIYVLRFVALLSIAVGFFNILPFPALDGGRLVFLLAEAAGGKKIVKSEIENFLHWLGFMILLILMAIITYHDIAKWVMHR